MAGSEVPGQCDTASGFGGADAVAGGQHVLPGFPADLVWGGPVHQGGQDAVIDRGVGAGVLLTLGQQTQQLGGIEHGEVGVQQGLDGRGAIGEGVLHRLPTARRIRLHD